MKSPFSVQDPKCLLPASSRRAWVARAAVVRALSGTLCGAVALGTLTLPATALAEDESPETLIRQGVQLRKKGQNEKAHGYFQRAYDLGHTPRAAAQLGLSDVALGLWLESESLLTEALASTDPWIDANRAALEKGRGLARGHLGSVKITGVVEGAAVEMGSAPSVRVLEGAELWGNPGEVAVRVKADGYKVFEKSVTLETGKVASLAVTLQALPKPPVVLTPPARKTNGPAEPTGQVGGRHAGALPPPKPPGPSPEDEQLRQNLRIASLVTGGVGVAALGVGAAFQVIAAKKQKAITDGKGMPYDEANGNFATFDKLGWGFLVGGGVLTVAGLVGVILTGAPEGEGEKQATDRKHAFLSLGCGLTSCTAGVAGSF